MSRSVPTKKSARRPSTAPPDAPKQKPRVTRATPADPLTSTPTVATPVDNNAPLLVIESMVDVEIAPALPIVEVDKEVEEEPPIESSEVLEPVDDAPSEEQAEVPLIVDDDAGEDLGDLVGIVEDDEEDFELPNEEELDDSTALEASTTLEISHGHKTVSIVEPEKVSISYEPTPIEEEDDESTPLVEEDDNFSLNSEPPVLPDFNVDLTTIELPPIKPTSNNTQSHVKRSDIPEASPLADLLTRSSFVKPSPVLKSVSRASIVNQRASFRGPIAAPQPPHGIIQDTSNKGTSTDDLFLHDTNFISQKISATSQNLIKIESIEEDEDEDYIHGHQDAFSRKSMLTRPLTPLSRPLSRSGPLAPLPATGSLQSQVSRKSLRGLSQRGISFIAEPRDATLGRENTLSKASASQHPSSSSTLALTFSYPAYRSSKLEASTDTPFVVSSVPAAQAWNKQLQASDNPLLELYDKYSALLSEVWRSKLYAAAMALPESSGTNDGASTRGNANNSWMSISLLAKSTDNHPSPEQPEDPFDTSYPINAPIIPTIDPTSTNNNDANKFAYMSHTAIQKQFETAVPILENLRQTAVNNLTRLTKCEGLVSELVDQYSDDNQDGRLYQEKLETLFRLVISIIQISIHI